jgi:hypothetical protein
LMAIFISQKQMKDFEYWHEGSGSLVFSVIGTILLVGVVWLLIKLFTPAAPEPEEAEL